MHDASFHNDLNRKAVHVHVHERVNVNVNVVVDVNVVVHVHVDVDGFSQKSSWEGASFFTRSRSTMPVTMRIRSLIASPAIPDMLSNKSLPIGLSSDILVTNYF